MGAEQTRPNKEKSSHKYWDIVWIILEKEEKDKSTIDIVEFGKLT